MLNEKHLATPGVFRSIYFHMKEDILLRKSFFIALACVLLMLSVVYMPTVMMLGVFTLLSSVLVLYQVWIVLTDKVE